jgi:hypothetical protein
MNRLSEQQHRWKQRLEELAEQIGVPKLGSVVWHNVSWKPSKARVYSIHFFLCDDFAPRISLVTEDTRGHRRRSVTFDQVFATREECEAAEC